MRLDLSPSKNLGIKNEFNMFLWVVSKEIYTKGKKVKGLSEKNYNCLLIICRLYYEGCRVDVPESTKQYLKEKLEQSKEMYRDFLRLRKNYHIVNVRLF